MELEFHPKQGEAWNSRQKITLCCSGIQGGKTTVGALWALKQSAKWGKGSSAIIGAPTYKILNQSTLPTFFKYAAGRGIYQKSDQIFKFNSGLTAYIRTSTDPYSVEGIQDVRWIWLDEAGICKYAFWINLEGRAARTNAPILCTTTPYGMNWPYHHLIKPLRDGERNDVAYYEWLSIDNPTFPREEYERQKRILDPRTFRRKYMGIHERMEGLVYELTDDNFCDPKALPANTRFFGGVDFGYTDGHEFAVVIRGVTVDGFHYEIDEFRQAGLEPSKQILLLQAKMRTYGVEMFYCDPSRPDMIAELNKAGVTSIAFHTAKNNYKPVLAGINRHIELIRSGRYKIFRGKCPSLCDEYETYHWPSAEDGTVSSENPVKVNDNLMDAVRHVTVGTMNIKIKEERNFGLYNQKFHEIDAFNPQKKSRRKESDWNSY